MIKALEIVFWFLVGTVFYTYAGYPLILFLVSSFSRKPVVKEKYEPTVSIVVSVYNEEKTIEQKLQNLLELDYPEEKLEILVGSDGASDKTDQIISKFHSSRIRFYRFVANFGKPLVLNELVKEAHGSVIVFTDARQSLDRQAVKTLVKNFSDPRIGCVSGELYFRSETSGSVEEGMDVYWRYEKFLRKHESRIGSMLGATGALYAVLRNLIPVLPAKILVDDMYIPLAVVKKGYRAIFENEAYVYDRPSTRPAEEFKRKVRTLAGNYQIFSHFARLLIPFLSPVGWQLFSHKFLRLMIPFCLIGIFFTNIFLLQVPFYKILFGLQIFFYILAIVEQIAITSGRTKKGAGYLPYMFCLLNYCAFAGFVHFMSRKQAQNAAWTRAYA